MEIEKRTSPFLKLAFKYRRVIKTGLDHGLTAHRKLDEQEAFKTVPRHELVVATVCDTLGKWIGLDDAEQDRLNIAALLHDADKKFEHRPKEFSPEQKATLLHFIGSQNNDLMSATKEAFVEEHKDGVDRLPLPQMLLYYSDMIVAWDKVTPFRERIAESRTRRPDLPDAFFETELQFGAAVEQRIFNMLPADIKTRIENPAQIPTYLIRVLGEK